MAVIISCYFYQFFSLLYKRLDRKGIHIFAFYKINGLKEVNIKTRTYNFFDNIINIKKVDPNEIKIDEK